MRSSAPLSRLIAIGCLFTSLGQVENVFASVFLPTVEELAKAAEQTEAEIGLTLDLRRLPRQVENGRSYVVIDDMLIDAASIQPNGAATGNLWTNGNVYYVFDAAVSSANRQNWRDAAADWSAVASVNFIEGLGSCTVNCNYIYIQNSDGNSSWIGMRGGRQEMNIFNWSFKYIIAHEIGHALGLIHEHQRTDRNPYVTIFSDNIESGREHNFETVSATTYGQYDFDSVMHYPQCAFTVCDDVCNPSCRTILVNSPYTEWQDSIGQRSHLSPLDQSAMAQRYGGTPTPTPTVPPCGTALSQNFDSVTAPNLPSGWLATNNGGDNTRWVTSVTSPHTAPNDAFIPDQTGISDKYLDSPGIAISSASAQLSFRNNFDTEISSGTYWDGGVLEVSAPNINGGAFTDILAAGGNFLSGGYTGQISGIASNPLANRMAWSGNSGGYINTVVNLGPNVNGQTIKLRFRFGTDENTSAPGWRIDTVSVTGAPCGTPTPPPTGTNLGNISTRLRVETGDNVLIGGFIVTGTQPKPVIVRAISSSLPLAGNLPDPTLELRNGQGGLIWFNDDWQFGSSGFPSQQAAIIATGIPPTHIRESAIVTTLPANNSAYTAIVRGFNNGTGIGVVEAYDLDRTVNSKLANISTRGFVGTGDNVMIGGMIVLGSTPANVLIRAIGPSLTNFGVPNALPDPTLELRDGNGQLIVSNDDWWTHQEAEIMATGIPPTHDRESAILWSLPPGGYTAIVRGWNNLIGVALVEAYQLQ